MFNKQETIDRLTPHANKLVAHYEHKGVSFLPKDGDFENVVFFNKVKEVKIAWDCFYRFSGIACTHRDKGENSVEVIILTDESFMGAYMKGILDMHFFPKEKN